MIMFLICELQILVKVSVLQSYNKTIHSELAVDSSRNFEKGFPVLMKL